MVCEAAANCPGGMRGSVPSEFVIICFRPARKTPDVRGHCEWALTRSDREAVVWKGCVLQILGDQDMQVIGWKAHRALPVGKDLMQLSVGAGEKLPVPALPGPSVATHGIAPRLIVALKRTVVSFISPSIGETGVVLQPVWIGLPRIGTLPRAVQRLIHRFQILQATH
jgi:hypothetical protein